MGEASYHMVKSLCSKISPVNGQCCVVPEDAMVEDEEMVDEENLLGPEEEGCEQEELPEDLEGAEKEGGGAAEDMDEGDVQVDMEDFTEVDQVGETSFGEVDLDTGEAEPESSEETVSSQLATKESVNAVDKSGGAASQDDITEKQQPQPLDQPDTAVAPCSTQTTVMTADTTSTAVSAAAPASKPAVGKASSAVAKKTADGTVSQTVMGATKAAATTAKPGPVSTGKPGSSGAAKPSASATPKPVTTSTVKPVVTTTPKTVPTVKKTVTPAPKTVSVAASSKTASKPAASTKPATGVQKPGGSQTKPASAPKQASSATAPKQASSGKTTTVGQKMSTSTPKPSHQPTGKTGGLKSADVSVIPHAVEGNTSQQDEGSTTFEAGDDSFDVQVDDTMLKELDADLLDGEQAAVADGQTGPEGDAPAAEKDGSATQPEAAQPEAAADTTNDADTKVGGQTAAPAKVEDSTQKDDKKPEEKKDEKDAKPVKRFVILCTAFSFVSIVCLWYVLSITRPEWKLPQPSMKEKMALCLLKSDLFWRIHGWCLSCRGRVMGKVAMYKWMKWWCPVYFDLLKVVILTKRICLMHMSNRWIYVLNCVWPARWSFVQHVLKKNPVKVGHYAQNISVSCFMHAMLTATNYYWRLPLNTTCIGLDLAWESQGQQKVKALRFFFSHTSQPTRVKFGVM